MGKKSKKYRKRLGEREARERRKKEIGFETFEEFSEKKQTLFAHHGNRYPAATPAPPMTESVKARKTPQSPAKSINRSDRRVTMKIHSPAVSAAFFPIFRITTCHRGIQTMVAISNTATT